MISDHKTESSLGLTSLVSGIVEDVRTLIAQQLTLFRSEIKDDLGRTKRAAIPMVIGVAVCLLAGFFLGMTAARLLVYLFEIPDFVALGIVTGILAIAGIVLVLIGATRFESVDALPENSVQTLKENILWKTKK